MPRPGLHHRNAKKAEKPYTQDASEDAGTCFFTVLELMCYQGFYYLKALCRTSYCAKKGEVGFATTPFYTIALTLELSRRLNFISWSGWVHTSLKGSWTMGQQVRPSRQAFYFSSLKLKWRMANHGAERLEALQLRCKVVPHSLALLLTHCQCKVKWWRVRRLSGQRLAARVLSLGGISGYWPKGSGCVWKIA